MTIDQVMAAILQDQVFYDETGGGMTLSGGEPLAQAGFVSEILSACRQHQIHTALDTSGYASWKTLDALRTLVDLFLYDVKFIRDESHKRYTGVSNRIILENLERLSSLGHQAIVRLPIIPGITDTQENLDEIARFLAHLEGIIRLDILPYHNAGANKYALAGKTYSLDHLETPSDQRMAEIAKVFENAGLAVQIGG